MTNDADDKGCQPRIGLRIILEIQRSPRFNPIEMGNAFHYLERCTRRKGDQTVVHVRGQLVLAQGALVDVVGWFLPTLECSNEVNEINVTFPYNSHNVTLPPLLTGTDVAVLGDIAEIPLAHADIRRPFRFDFWTVMLHHRHQILHPRVLLMEKHQ